jgi:hypothetical protein
MSKKKLVAIIVGCIMAIIVVIVIAEYQGRSLSILNPYQSESHRYKVQLHCHTTNSDGTQSPSDVATTYKNAGYDALAITDHNYLTPDPGVSGILHINGVEETLSQAHIVNLFATQVESGMSYPVVSNMSPQDVIDKILLDGALADIAHPWITYHVWTGHMLQQLVGYQLIEIANTRAGYDGRLYTDEDDWDFLLTRARKVWAIGVDDCHDVSDPTEFNRYFVEINADELTASALEESLRQGDFYVRQTGAPQITVSVSSNVITCDSSASADIQFIGKNGLVLQTTNNVTQSSYTIQGWEQYVRIKAVDNATATYYTWSQPISILS